MNSVDLAIAKVRELQSQLYDNNSSPNSLFKKTEEIIQCMNDASREINTNYEEISDKLTKQMNTGRKQ